MVRPIETKQLLSFTRMPYETIKAGSESDILQRVERLLHRI